MNSLLKREGANILKIVTGCFLYALSVVWFIDPARIIPGSVTGIGVVVKALTGFPIGVLNLLINIPLVLFGTFKLGKKLLIYTGLTVLLNSLMMDGLAGLKPMTDNVLLASVFGGVVMGVGLGLILDGGGTTGGTTVVGRLISKDHPDIPMGDILMLGDFVIILVGAVLMRSWDLLLYSIIDLYVCVVVINRVLYGGKVQSLLVLRTRDGQRLAQALRTQPHCRIVYCGPEVVMAVCKKKQVSTLQRAAQREDPTCAGSSMDADYSFEAMNVEIER